MLTLPIPISSRLSYVAFVAGLLVLSGCQKSKEEKTPVLTASEEAPREVPTGLVKNPVRQSADLTKWMDIASTKSPAQIAREEREKAAKAELEAKALAAKAAIAATAHDAGKPTLAPSVGLANTRATVAPVVPAAAPIKGAPSEVAPKQVAPVALAVGPAASPPTVEQSTLKVINSVQPKFPIAVAREGITEGLVSARLHVEPDGKVSRVEIVKAKPSRHFDKEVIAAASQWKYAPISHPQVAVVEFSFKLDN